ncbi:MAG: S9 family peptidase [Candidatus Electryonea clarkiae]|nr:S9 family peptidase [Candidatus Electryonea clarkiae]MDP8285795.1 S9 family peptidase [Candidatus Electryonea clarkiae]
MTYFQKTLIILLAVVCVVSFSFSETSEPVTTSDDSTESIEPVPVNQWLVTEAVLMPHAQIDPDTSADQVADLLGFPPIDPKDFWVEAGQSVSFAPGKQSTFNKISGENITFAKIPDPGSEQIYIAYAASYLDVPLWGELKFEVTGRAPFKLYLDGEKALERTSAADSDTDKVSEKKTIDIGFHRLMLITAVCGKDSLDEWSFGISASPTEKEVDNTPLISADPKHHFDFQDYYLIDAVSGLEISRDGRWLAAGISPWDRSNDKREKHLEIWDMKNKEKIWEYFSAKGISNTRWSPDGKQLLFSTGASEKGSDVYLWNRADQKFERIMHGLEHSSGFRWSPDGNVIYYTKTKKWKDEDEKPYKVMWGLEDRWSGWRDDTEIHYMTLDGRAHGKLTSGKYDPGRFAISPDGSTILMLRSITAVERPFGITEFWKISTSTGDAKKVFEFRTWSVGRLAFSPDGKSVAFDAPIYPVDGNESKHPDNNDNATDLWILDLESGKAVNYTREFEPAIAAGAYGTGRGGILFWHENGSIGFTGLYNKKVKLYFFDTETHIITEHSLPTPGASYGDASIGIKSNVFVFQGDQPERPGDIYFYDWKKKKGEMLKDLHPKFKRLIKPGKIIDYDYVNSDGVTIPGYLYYPVNYDNTKKYPLIVDFYGGVFGFADGYIWMSNVFATRGYFVYIPTPRGAAGWGQEFADYHPNDWGILTTRDMNEGVRNIVNNVPAVDGSKCATVSGSYGGFMTMYMLSQPKDHKDFYPYATGISDYGISNLASYWGVGWWGYLYSDMATARNYPWNNPQYYIDHSPLYFADNITVPLLLLHGDADVNVPPMESDQMYTALKVLNREVEFIRFPGENHGIASKRGKYLLTKRMHSEWFDKHLKGQPGAWDKRMEKERKK